jgi:hypothetical protein
MEWLRAHRPIVRAAAALAGGLALVLAFTLPDDNGDGGVAPRPSGRPRPSPTATWTPLPLEREPPAKPGVRAPAEPPARIVEPITPRASAAASTAPAEPPSAPPAQPADTPADRQRAWLSARLIGHDNALAALRAVTLVKVGGGYRVTINNQFGFRCDLRFDDQGRPAELRDCAGPEDWRPRERSIKLRCEDRPEGEVWRGQYTLVAEGYSHPDSTIQLVRLPARGP